MSQEIFEINNNGDVVYCRQFLWFSKYYIVNDVEKQKQLVKLLEAKNSLFSTGLGNDGFMPIMFIFALFGVPLYFGLEYLFPSLSKFIILTFIFLLISSIFIWDYYSQIDKILHSV